MHSRHQEEGWRQHLTLASHQVLEAKLKAALPYLIWRQAKTLIDHLLELRLELWIQNHGSLKSHCQPLKARSCTLGTKACYLTFCNSCIIERFNSQQEFLHVLSKDLRDPWTRRLWQFLMELLAASDFGFSFYPLAATHMSNARNHDALELCCFWYVFHLSEQNQ